MRRSELRDPKRKHPTAFRMAKWALKGAAIGPAVFMGLIILEGCFEIAFHPSAWNLGTLKIAASLTIASSAAGAFSGLFFPLVEKRIWIMIPVLTIGGSVGGAVFWVVYRPDASLGECVIGGTLVLPALFLLVLLEGVGEAVFSSSEEKPMEKPTHFLTGPTIDCPKCGQQTANHDFCEICGTDIRVNRPPLVLADGTVVEDRRPNR